MFFRITISLLFLLFSSCGFAQGKKDSLPKLNREQAVKQKNGALQGQNALPYLHCPLEIRFNPYDSIAGYMEIHHPDGKLYKTSKIDYPQYHFQTWEACDWPKETFLVYLYSNHGTALNKFKVQYPPVEGQIGNTGDIQDLRKRKHKWLCSKKTRR